MTIEQLNYLLRKELYAIKNHKDNILRITGMIECKTKMDYITIEMR